MVRMPGGKVVVIEGILIHIVQAAGTDRQVIGFQRLLAQGCDLAGGRVAGYGDDGLVLLRVWPVGVIELPLPENWGHKAGYVCEEPGGAAVVGEDIEGIPCDGMGAATGR